MLLSACTMLLSACRSSDRPPQSGAASCDRRATSARRGERSRTQTRPSRRNAEAKLDACAISNPEDRPVTQVLDFSTSRGRGFFPALSLTPAGASTNRVENTARGRDNKAVTPTQIFCISFCYKMPYGCNEKRNAHTHTPQAQLPCTRLPRRVLPQQRSRSSLTSPDPPTCGPQKTALYLYANRITCQSPLPEMAGLTPLS